MLLAVVVSAAAVAAREAQYADVRYDRFHVPAFDGHLYLAMAESPSYFTVAPWGYRVLQPWLLWLFPLPNPAPAFFWSTVLGLTCAGVLLFLYLRRLGHGALAALLAVAAFGASEPVGEVVRYQFLVEPLTLALELAFLLALEAGAGLPLLALVVLLGTLSKEFFLLLLPLVYLARRGSDGRLNAFRQALLVGLPAVATSFVLRLWWTPHISPPMPDLQVGAVGLALERLRESWREWWTAILLSGLTPLSVLGALRARARPLVLPAAYLFLATLGAPLLNPVAFYAADVRRLLLYALPAVMPLALLALDRVWPHAGPAPPPAAPRLAWNRAAALAVAALMALPLLVVDRYRRFDLQGTSDALRALAVCRETLRTARELEAGAEFVFDPSSGRFSQGVREEGSLVELRRVRWFLGRGWDPLAYRGEGEATQQGGEASLLVPSLHPRDLRASLTLRASAEVGVRIGVNGRSLDEARVGTKPSAHVLILPAGFLFRGDNVLTLTPQNHAPVTLAGYRLDAAARSAAEKADYRP